jgi:hypothetical protein
MENNIETPSTSRPAMILSSVGFLAGLYYSFKNDKGFWGYVGYGLLGTVAGTTAGSVLSMIGNKK